MAPAATATVIAPNGTVDDGPLDPGDYSSDSTGATITFSIAGTIWEGLRDIPDVGFALLTDQFGGPASLSVSAFPGAVFSDPCDLEGPTDTVEMTPEAFMTWLASVEGVEAAVPADATVGGRPALVLDLTTKLPAACTDPPWIFLWVLPEVGEFHFADNETVRLWAVQAADAMVVLVAEADPQVDTDAFFSSVDGILETMEID